MMICFALLAHKDEYALEQQIRNIRKYNPNDIRIVLYNGGRNPDFGKKVCEREQVYYCSYSKPLVWGKTGRFFYDVMRWLEDYRIDYEYLVYTEHDVLFVNSGFRNLLEHEMDGYDCLVKIKRHLTHPSKTWWIPGKTMWKEWNRWKPFFGSEDFYGTFNPMQVYRHGIVKRMLGRMDRPRLEMLFRETEVFALGEMLYLTVAMFCGAMCKEYPKEIQDYLRVYHPIKQLDIEAAKNNSKVFFVHPVKDKSVRDWISGQ